MRNSCISQIFDSNRKYNIMKKIVTLVHLLCVTMAVLAQPHAVRVEAVDLLPIEGYHANFNPEGDKILFTSSNYKGLKTYDIANQEERKITDARGAGYQPIYGTSEIVYRKKEASGQWEAVDLKTLETSSIDEKSARRKRTPSGVRVANSFYKAEAGSELHEIILFSVSGEQKKIQPLGASEDYLSISLSPNQEKVLFRVSGLGSFVSDLDGNVLFELGNVEFPRWISNEEVLFAQVQDDGHQYLSSDLYVTRLGSGEKELLTESLDDIPIYPSVAPSQDKIICHTPKGRLYLIRLSR